MSRYFLGWYFKCQSEQETIAVIPALHKANGKKSCSIQLITRRASWSLSFPDAPFPRRKLEITIGENRFSAAGIELHLHGEGLHAECSLRFGPFSPLRYDIMGPFCCLPFMECRHSIRSMLHTVNGALQINDVPYLFQNAVGYLEGDRGRSFPRAYIWTQCCFPEGSLVLCVAEIPLAGFRFTGVIGAVLWRGREYRLATYLGARAVTIGGGAVTVQQGSLRLTARLLEKSAQPLCAPVGGVMRRTIHESAACLAGYTLEKDSHICFSLESPLASFEYEYPN